MRAAVVFILFVVLGLRALLPNTASYICSGMGGRHLEKPCCPDKPVAEAEQPAFPQVKTHCCEEAPSLALPTQTTPRSPQSIEFEHTFAARVLLAIEVLLPQSPARSRSFYGRPPPNHLPSSLNLHRVLRI